MTQVIPPIQTRQALRAQRALRALRALRDCGVLRVGFDSDAFFDLFDRGYADCAPVDGREDALDYFLTANGAKAAMALKWAGAL